MYIISLYVYYDFVYVYYYKMLLSLKCRSDLTLKINNIKIVLIVTVSGRELTLKLIFKNLITLTEYYHFNLFTFMHTIIIICYRYFSYIHVIFFLYS